MENNALELQVSKQFNCSKEKVFDAWTQPEQLKQWWKPMGKHLTEVVNDIKEGGEVKYVFEDKSLTIDGKYNKVQPNNLLEYTWNWHLNAVKEEEADYKLLVQFSGDGDNATLQVTQTGFANKESVQPHQQGWEQGLQQLYDFVSAGNSEANSTSDASKEEDAAQKFMPPVTGYNETPEQAKVGGG